MTCALYERKKMNSQQTRVFVLFYAGHSRSHIADLCGVHQNKIDYMLEKYGFEFVNFHIKKEVLHTIHKALQEKKTTKEISALVNLTEPVTRFIIKRLPSELIVNAPKLKKEDARLTLRCSCGKQFTTSLFEIDNNNPKRQCKDCLNANNASK